MSVHCFFLLQMVPQDHPSPLIKVSDVNFGAKLSIFVPNIFDNGETISVFLPIHMMYIQIKIAFPISGMKHGNNSSS